jgi:hypothetical protein
MVNKKIRPTDVVALVFMLAAIASVIYFICGPMEGYLHSDFTDTIYWANASLESGRVFDPEFGYAALLPFSANLWFTPLIAFFGVSMTTQVIGMIIFTFVFAASLYFMCRSLEWSIPWSASAVGVTVLLLSTSSKLREIMWGHVIYYSLILVLLFVGIGLAVRLLRKRTVTLCILTALWAILSATDGLQIVAMVLLPVAGAILAERFFDGSKKLTCEENLKPAVAAAMIVLAGAVGLALLSVLKGDITAEYADGHMKLVSVRLWMDNLLLLPTAWFELVGFDEIKLGMGGVEAVVATLGGVAMIVAPVMLIFDYKSIERSETKILLWSHLAVSVVTVGGWVCGTLAGAEWRLTSMMGTAAVTSVASVRHFVMKKSDGEGSAVTKRVSILLAACLLTSGIVGGALMLKMPADYGRDNLDHRLAEKLKSEGLEYRYATFWRSQTITLISDSEIKVREILADEFDGVYTDCYQSSRAWYEDQEGVSRYFVLLEEYEAGDALRNIVWEEYVEENATEIIEFENFFIYVFDENIDFEYLAEMQPEW